MGLLPESIQELNPKMARLCLGIEKFGNLKCGKKFASSTMIVGVSGGIDSTALLIIATLLARKSGGRVFCAHVDHGLRDNSADDRGFVEDLCARLNIPVESFQADVSGYASNNSIGLEEAGRIMRYDFFKRCMKKFEADFLLLAHHIGDLSEDILMRLIRGTGWPALAGMDAFDPKRKLLRPLLSTTKDELEVFLKSIGCSWREDESNLCDDYTRNRIRNRVMPLLREENSNLDTGLLRLKYQAELDEDYWAEQTAEILKMAQVDENGALRLSCSILDKCHSALRFRIYKKILDNLGPGHALFESVVKLDNGFCARNYGATFQFPGNKVVKISKKELLFKVN
ncbi:tRNA lysidine(34) synthetase TilS [Maridesulfovibrio sp.]|uniref:tRNA lysidine(34) synthetase TilS n=1 Tax=Maridesulfovibrio sp. TaxID=2795000 RepID=UPI0029CA59A8|nr:tRNA lysidine(34) synthetase TilS [Maridesulfovibrio sp.]